MTLEEIINVDWTEQTDLTEYVKYFEDQQLLREQLTYFTYQYLRTKLISWEELKEEGLENVNLFNFGYTSAEIQGKSYRIAYPVYKRFIRIDPYYIIKHVDPYDIKKHLDYPDLYYPIDITTRLLEKSGNDLDIVLEKAKEIYKEYSAPAEYIEALVLAYLLKRDNGYGYERRILFDINEVVERLSVNQYIEFLDREPNISFISWYEGIILNKDVIEFGLQQKFSDLLKNIKIDLDTCYNHYLGKPKPDALYYINDLGQPIFVALESKFNKDYISTEIDIKNNRVKFNFRTYGSYWGEGDNGLVHQCLRYTDYVEVDLTEDKIIDRYE
jgi:hypothetical protein